MYFLYNNSKYQEFITIEIKFIYWGGYLMGFEVENMDVHFDKCASDYDRHFYEDLGMGEFYDEIEKQINICGEPKNILVLGCGTGLEIERFNHSSIVTAIDISSGMLSELKKKKLSPLITLKTVCNSYFDVSFTENSFDLVLSTYSFHHFTAQQKADLYKKIYNCLKVNACFINGDTVCNDKDTELNLLNTANELYQKQQLPFGSIHIDVPLALETELSLLSDTGFSTVSVIRKWTKTALIKSIK
jgi:ubiquinone/menaquinone biosynthesis C-methylase UbiE